MADIFSPAALGDLHLRNRIVMAPMTRGRAGPHDEPAAAMVEYYRQRASAGLIVTEGTQPSPAGKGYWRTPGIHSQVQVEGWRQVAAAVHAEGGQIVMQLMHCGRASVRANKAPDADTVAPSAIACPDPIPGPDGQPSAPEMPRELGADEIPAVIDEYVRAARNARLAGIDGVELHCASGYLPMQFLSSNTNQRTDRYGGSAAARCRFVVETLEALAGAIGPGRVGFRICPGVTFNGMADAAPAETYATLLGATRILSSGSAGERRWPGLIGPPFTPATATTAGVTPITPSRPLPRMQTRWKVEALHDWTTQGAHGAGDGRRARRGPGHCPGHGQGWR